MTWDKTFFDPGEDWDLFDGVVDVTYSQFNEETDSYTALSGTVPALFREVSETVTAIEGGETIIVDTVIHIPVDKISIEPNRRDRVSYNSKTWYVHGVRTQTLGTRYRLACTQV